MFETGEGEEVAFARVIAPSGGTAEAYTSHYRIDGREVRWDAYNARLQSYGILVQARNFLVFQARTNSCADPATGGTSALLRQQAGDSASAVPPACVKASWRAG